MTLARHRHHPGEAVPSPFERGFPAPDWWSHFDDVFRDERGRRMLRVEEFNQDHTLVVRAEMPGIDPDRDVEISVADGMLTIRAERAEDKATNRKHFHRKEICYGGLSRTLALPDGVGERDIKASYHDGVLEVRVPVPDVRTSGGTRVPVVRAQPRSH